MTSNEAERERAMRESFLAETKLIVNPSLPLTSQGIRGHMANYLSVSKAIRRVQSHLTTQKDIEGS